MRKVTNSQNSIIFQKNNEIHTTATTRAFPLIKTSLEHTWLSNPIYTTLTDTSRIKSKKYLDKLYTHCITTLTQIQNKDIDGRRGLFFCN